jgi:dolichyl-phosphate-mannose-protein mannosyltransferase
MPLAVVTPTRSARPSTSLASRFAWLNRPLVAILAVGAIAGILRFVNLEYPQQRVFDEYYYSKSACIFLGYSNERCDINSSDERYWRNERNDTGAWVHPPLGKWMIAFGELAFGTDSFGWRVAAAATGTATVIALAAIVQLLFHSPIWTFTGGLLLAVEGLHFVQSRTAMLDIFVAFWIVIAFLFLLLDRRWIDTRDAVRRRADDDENGSTTVASRVAAPLWRPWRFAAGVALGAGFATKWSALTAVAAVGVLAFIWEVSRRRRAGVRRALADAIPAEGFGLVLALLVVPSLVYVASYAGWFAIYGFEVVEWMELQGAIYTYHRELRTIDEATGEPVHGYLAHAWKWILLWRPVFYYADYGEGVRQVIYANGNPAIFWGSIVGIPYTALAWWRKGDWRAGFVVVAVAGLYLPWFLVPRPQFLFDATPITPFLVLACVYALRDLADVRYSALHSIGRAERTVRPYLPVAAGFVVTAVGLFVWFWPVLTGAPVSDEAWTLRAWFPSWT